MFKLVLKVEFDERSTHQAMANTWPILIQDVHGCPVSYSIIFAKKRIV